MDLESFTEAMTQKAEDVHLRVESSEYTSFDDWSVLFRYNHKFYFQVKIVADDEPNSEPVRIGVWIYQQGAESQEPVFLDDFSPSRFQPIDEKLLAAYISNRSIDKVQQSFTFSISSVGQTNMHLAIEKILTVLYVLGPRIREYETDKAA